MLTKRIQTIEGILKNLKQRTAYQCQLGDDFKRKIDSVSGKMKFM